MITTSTILTLSLAKVIGAYMIAGGLSLFTGKDRWRRVLDEFRERPGATYLAGVAAYTIGAAVVMAHNVWTDPLAGFVSLVGWVSLIEGLIIIVWPALLLDFSDSLMKPAFLRIFAIFTIVVGALVMIAGFTGRVALS